MTSTDHKDAGVRVTDSTHTSRMGTTPNLVWTEGEPALGTARTQYEWLISLRWGAMSMLLLASFVGPIGIVPGINFPMMVCTALLGLGFNFALRWRLRNGAPAVAGAMLVPQAILDMVLLTLALAACGGLETPFLGFYFFHVAITGILGALWGGVAAALAAGLLVGLLKALESSPALQLGVWDPVPPFDWLSEGIGFVSALVMVAYIVHRAMRQLKDREAALNRARDRLQVDYELLSTTLDELGAGLELVADSEVIWKNRRAANIGAATVGMLADQGGTRFPVTMPDGERVYEVQRYVISPDEQGGERRMNLYLDRTQAVMAEQQLLLAERLASLGRVAQGVAHELNTPLATIKTLATDLRAVVEDLKGVDADVLDDLRESIILIRDETARLGRITQSLLTRGERARSASTGIVGVLDMVRRAQAVVFAGARGAHPEVVLEESLNGIHVAVALDPLMQILVNLLQNAADAVRDEPSPRIVIAVETKGSAIHLSVQDNGPGVDSQMETRIFEPFSTTKPPGEGTGLGLYTSYMLAQSMQGDLRYMQTPEGQGARFLLEMPSAPCVSEVEEEAKPVHPEELDEA
jgi:signal transduction histidine kinase